MLPPVKLVPPTLIALLVWLDSLYPELPVLLAQLTVTNVPLVPPVTLLCVPPDISLMEPMDVPVVLLTVVLVLPPLLVLLLLVMLVMLTTLTPTFVTHAQPTVVFVLMLLPVPLQLIVIPDTSKPLLVDVQLVDLTVTLALMLLPVPLVLPDIWSPLVPVLPVPLTVIPVPLPENVEPALLDTLS